MIIPDPDLKKHFSNFIFNYLLFRQLWTWTITWITTITTWTASALTQTTTRWPIHNQEASSFQLAMDNYLICKTTNIFWNFDFRITTPTWTTTPPTLSSQCPEEKGENGATLCNEFKLDVFKILWITRVIINCSKFVCSKKLVDTIFHLLETIRANVTFFVNCSKIKNHLPYVYFEQFHF